MKSAAAANQAHEIRGRNESHDHEGIEFEVSDSEMKLNVSHYLSAVESLEYESVLEKLLQSNYAPVVVRS